MSGRTEGLTLDARSIRLDALVGGLVTNEHGAEFRCRSFSLMPRTLEVLIELAECGEDPGSAGGSWVPLSALHGWELQLP